MTSIHARTIRALIVSQRLLGISPLSSRLYAGRNPLMARIQITEGVMLDAASGAFLKAVKAEFAALAHDFAVKS